MTFSAWDFARYGGPEVLTPVSRPTSKPAADQVLVRIRASAVSRADSLMRAGQPKFARVFLGLTRPRAGLVGTCFSGDVVAVGDTVTNFRVGEAVFGEAGMQFGANASHICVDEGGSLLIKPDTVSYQEAATLFDGAMTFWHFLNRVAKVQPGENVLILGGSGSLGTAAIQFAKALGAKITASASACNAELVQSLGAGRVVDYNIEDPLKPGAKFEVVFDTFGVSSFGAAKPALGEGGRYLCPVIGLALLRDVILSGLFGCKKAMLAAAGLLKPEVHREELSDVLALMARKQFSPAVDRTYPLYDLVEAHSYVETGRKRGNGVVIQGGTTTPTPIIIL